MMYVKCTVLYYIHNTTTYCTVTLSKLRKARTNVMKSERKTTRVTCPFHVTLTQRVPSDLPVKQLVGSAKMIILAKNVC